MEKSVPWAAEILPPDGVTLFEQVAYSGIVGEPVHQVPQETRRIGAASSVAQEVVHPQAVFFPPHEPRILQDLQMLGDGRVGDPPRGLDLADAPHPLLKQ